jgi:hypothetical protein
MIPAWTKEVQDRMREVAAETGRYDEASPLNTAAGPLVAFLALMR